MITMLKILGIAALLVVAVMVGIAVGLMDETTDWNEKDGWFIRPFKHLRCGAVYGHLYIKDTPKSGGWYGVRCKRCGKIIVRKVKNWHN